MLNVFANNAQRFAERGFEIRPVPQGQKHPSFENWQCFGMTDPESVRNWVVKYPDFNIGAVTGPFNDGFLIVLDMDVKHPPVNGVLTLQKWEILNGPLPKTLSATTPSGGRHLFYKANCKGLKHHSGIKAPASGVDVQADGAFVMLPPSMINGKSYRFDDPTRPIASATEAVYRFIDHVVSLDGGSAKPVDRKADHIEAAFAQYELKPVMEALKKIPCEKLSYDDWIHIGAALYNSGATVDVWDKWSQTDSARYTDGECERKWATFATSRLNWNAGTIFKIAKKYGYRAADESTGTNRPRLVCASDIAYEPPRWCLAPYLQIGKGCMIQGDPGTGKTAFMMAVTAHITTGRPLLGLPVATPGDVLILSVEDDLPVLRGRLEANGADLNKCHFMTDAAGLTFNSPEIEEAVQATHAKLIIFDPFQAFLGAKVDMNSSNETRPELAKLFEMCARNNVACGIVAHTSKGKADRSPVNRSLGSTDIPAAMRSILELTENPNVPGEKVMVHVKCSNAPRGHSIAYTIGDRGGVTWKGFSSIGIDDLMTVQRRKAQGVPYESDVLAQVFRKLMELRPAGGFWSYTDVKKEGAKLLGYPPFNSISDLRRKLDSGLTKELQLREGLIVSYGETGRSNIRGLTIERSQQKS